MKKFFINSMLLVMAVVLGSAAAMADSHNLARIYVPERILMDADEVYNVPVYMDADGADINGFQYAFAISEGFQVGKPYKAERLDSWDGTLTISSNMVFGLSYTGTGISNENNDAPIMYIPISRKAGADNTEGTLKLTKCEVTWAVDGQSLSNGLTTTECHFAVVDDQITLDVSDVTLTAGATANVQVSLNNPFDLTMASFVVNVPEGVTLSNVHLADRVSSTGAELMTNKFSATEYQIIILNFSVVETSFEGNSGVILTFDLEASEAYEGGKMVLSEVQFTNKEAVLYYIHDVVVNLDGTSAINGIQLGEGPAKFYNLGGVEVNPTPGNIYIKVANGKASKVLVK